MNLDFFPAKLTNDRRVFLVKINSGWGEIAPLLLNDRDCLQIKEDLTKLKTNLKPIVNLSLDEIPLILKDYTNPFVRYGIEQALLHHLANEKDQTLAEFLSKTDNPTSDIKINAFIPRVSTTEAEEMTDQFILQGYKQIKVKVGSNDIAADIDRVQIVRQKAGEKIRIHLDANGAWQKHNVIDRLLLLAKFSIDYIEQPLRTLTELVWLKNYSPIPLAVDEAVTSLAELKTAIDLNCCEYIVIKPMLWGGILNAYAGVELARSHGLSVVLTGTLEGTIGRWGVYELGRATRIDRACGLTGFNYLSSGMDCQFFNVPALL